MENKLLFKLRDVNKSYDTGTQSVHAIRNLTCDIYHSDFTVIMGSSGSGKSTLLYLLSGMDHVTSGDVIYNEIPIHQLKEKQLLTLRKKRFWNGLSSYSLNPLFDTIRKCGSHGKT